MKKRLHYIALFLLGSVSVCTLLIYTSCNKDRCVTTHCYNGGTCHDGACTCASGYEGISCSTLSRQKFEGDYPAETAIDTVFSVVSVSAADAPDSVQIHKLDHYFTQTVKGYIAGKDTLVIPTQLVQDCTVSGLGVYVALHDIQVSYTINYPNGSVKTVHTVW